ncbi:MAG TPA: methyltransferase domain-containing protein, partial [Bacteroidota bacterium]
MNCCSSESCRGAASFFSRWSRKYAKRFRKKGLEKVQEYLLEGIRRIPLASAEVLDIGCGVGALHTTLLKEGAVHATAVDAAEGMVLKAQEIAEELGVRGKADYVVGDFVEKASEIREADIVTLDKVVCCYEHLEPLITGALGKTRRILALSWPRNLLIVRWTFGVQIFIARLFRAQFHPFWHDWVRMSEMIQTGGF